MAAGAAGASIADAATDSATVGTASDGDRDFADRDAAFFLTEGLAATSTSAGASTVDADLRVDVFAAFVAVLPADVPLAFAAGWPTPSPDGEAASSIVTLAALVVAVFVAALVAVVFLAAEDFVAAFFTAAFVADFAAVVLAAADFAARGLAVDTVAESETGESSCIVVRVISVVTETAPEFFNLSPTRPQRIHFVHS